MKKGMFRLSFDVEGTWRKGAIGEVAREDEMVRKLLGILAVYHIQATWAVVGKLFEENNTLIRTLQASGHHIASHSYTHEDFSHISEHQAREELRQSKKVAKKYDVDMMSFVFPFNHVHHQHLLAEYGFQTYRNGGMYFPSRRKWGRYIPSGWRYAAVKIGLDDAIRTGKTFQLWTHPIDLVDDDLFTEFSRCIMYASERKRQGQLI